MSVLETEELACKLVNLDYEEIDADTETIDEALQEKFGCDIYQFTELISKLLPMVDVGDSPLTGIKYKGFTSDGMWLSKVKVG